MTRSGQTTMKHEMFVPPSIDRLRPNCLVLDLSKRYDYQRKLRFKDAKHPLKVISFCNWTHLETSSTRSREPSDIPASATAKTARAANNTSDGPIMLRAKAIKTIRYVLSVEIVWETLPCKQNEKMSGHSLARFMTWFGRPGVRHSRWSIHD